MRRTEGSKAVSKRSPAARMGVVSLSREVTPVVDPEALEAELEAKVALFDSLLPGTEAPSEAMVRAIFTQSGELMALAEQVNSLSGTGQRARVGEPAPDFSFTTYDQLLADIAKADAEAPSEPALVDATARALRSPYQQLMVELLKLAVAALSVPHEVVNIATTLLTELAKADTQALARHIKNRHWREAKNSLGKIVKVMKSGTFKTRLINKIGRKTAVKIFAKVVAKLASPGGVLFIIASLVWEIARRRR